MKTTTSADQYRERQESLNAHFVHRVESWLTHFKIDYNGKVVHIIEGPRESKLPWRKGKVATLARFLGFGAKIRFSVGGIVGECPSFKPASMKATGRKVELVRKKGLKPLIIKETGSAILHDDEAMAERGVG